ncbi:MAG: hypothetical protein LC754_11355 [Acidobacteria bacterium]|nr:hypothetical protein [Acidobacteriota bacterium]
MSESVRSIPTFVPRAETFSRRRAARPTAREWVLHTSLFLLTALTATWAGITFLIPGNEIPDPSISLGTPLDYAFFIPVYYLRR